MQINKVQTTANKVERNINNNKSPNFKGLGVMNVIDTVSRGTANAIENGGLAVSFTLQDMLGTNLPRPIMGLMRNKKENEGQANKKFAAKELVREFTTGPSMFIIPAAILAIGKKTIGKTVDVPMNFIKNLGQLQAEKLPQTAQQFFTDSFSEILSNAKMDSSLVKDKASDFASRLANAMGDKKKLSATVGKLSSEFMDIAKKNTTNPAFDNYTQATIKGASSSFKNTVKYMTSYAQDILPKTAEKSAEEINKLASKKALTRFGINALMFGAVLGFLQVIPKLYNKAEGQENAGLKGLMKEETLGSEEKSQPKKDSKNPSFGANPKVVVDAMTKNNLLGKFVNAMEFDSFNMSFPLLGTAMLVGLIVPRIKNAKDKYDREEIARRDVTSCAVMLLGEKMMRKGFAKLNEHNTGLILTQKPQNFVNKNTLGRAVQYLRPVKGVRTLSTTEIISKYSGIDKFKNGITDFCNFISGQNGNLSKVFGMEKESAQIVGDLLKDKGTTLAEANNETITKVLTEAKDSAPVKKLVSLFHEPKQMVKKSNLLSDTALGKKFFKSTETVLNPWAKRAKTLNDRFTAFSVLLLVPILLGFALPFINERATKKKVKEENALNKQNSLNAFSLYNPACLKDDDRAKQIFSAFAK